MKANQTFHEIVSPLLTWYDCHARILPWREMPTPYRVWVSEIMLQQTRVEAVKPYYERFLEQFPDVYALAKASEEALLKLWEGLGYYNRVRTMQKTARLIVEDYGGELPASYESLLSLPGFGSYTAGAVASIAFGIPVPAVDGNVLRVFARLDASDADITLPAVKSAVTEQVRLVIPSDHAGDFNQSLMELGATVCLPNGTPKCEQCPLAFLCRGYQLGIAGTLPKKTPKKPRKVEKRTILLLLCREKVALRKRPSKGLLASMWEFPSLPGQQTESEILNYCKEIGFTANSIKALPSARHIFTHIEWQMTGFIVQVQRELPGFSWFDRHFPDHQIAIPSAFRVYLEQLHGGTD